MKTAVIVYRSRTGTARRLAEEIGAFLATREPSTRRLPSNGHTGTVRSAASGSSRAR